jgi:hypothetical protein
LHDIEEEQIDTHEEFIKQRTDKIVKVTSSL